MSRRSPRCILHHCSIATHLEFSSSSHAHACVTPGWAFLRVFSLAVVAVIVQQCLRLTFASSGQRRPAISPNRGALPCRQPRGPRCLMVGHEGISNPLLPSTHHRILFDGVFAERDASRSQVLSTATLATCTSIATSSWRG